MDFNNLRYDPFETYFTYGRLFHHFSHLKFQFFASDNDRFRYTFQKRWNELGSRQRFWSAMTRHFQNPDDARDHFLSVMVSRSPKIPLEEIYDVNAFKLWTNRIHAMYVHFDADLAKLRRAAGSVKKSIRATDGQPALYRLLMSGQISMETFAWLVNFQPKVIDVMDTSFDSLDLAWQSKRLIAVKYPVFLNRLNINQDRLKSILRGYLT